MVFISCELANVRGDHGHYERLGFVAGPQHYLPTQLKAAGREAVLTAARLDPGDLVAHTEFTFDGGRRGIAELPDRPVPPTAVICSSDLMAIGVLHEAGRRGLRVPEHLSVVGFDGIDATGWLLPALTTVAQPIAQIAETTVRTLEALIADPETGLPNSYFRPHLRIGGTTGPPPDGRTAPRRRAAAAAHLS